MHVTCEPAAEPALPTAGIAVAAAGAFVDAGGATTATAAAAVSAVDVLDYLLGAELSQGGWDDDVDDVTLAAALYMIDREAAVGASSSQTLQRASC
jgi:hypothetical protein